MPNQQPSVESIIRLNAARLVTGMKLLATLKGGSLKPEDLAPAFDLFCFGIGHTLMEVASLKTGNAVPIAGTATEPEPEQPRDGFSA